jgi:nucleoside-diphosphate-sugar epimerase
LLFVKDTVDGFIAIGGCSDLIGEDVNIATNSEISIGQLAEEILQQINPKAKIITDHERIRPEKSEVFRLFGDNSKILKYTNWQQNTTLKEGIAKTIEWFSNADNLKNYKADIYNV